MLSDADLRIRETGISALGHVGDEAAGKRLQSFAATTQLSEERESARNAAKDIRNRSTTPKDPEQRAADLERLEEKIKAFDKRLKEVERWR